MSEAISVEERNELNTQALQDIYGSIDNVEEAIKSLPTWQDANLDQIEGTLDNIKEAINNSDNGSYLHDINHSILSVGEMIFDLNKTLTRIDDSLRVIAQNR